MPWKSKRRERLTAWQAGMRLVAIRDRSARELLEALLRRGYPREEAEEAVRRIVEAGYVSDERLAERAVELTRERRPVAPRYLEAELARRGLAPELVEEAGRRLGEERALCREAATAFLVRHASLTGDARIRRLAAHLRRRGFAAEHIRAVLEELGAEDLWP